MKKWIVLLMIFLAGFHAFSQTTARLVKQKDAWGTEYTYVGAVKKNKPDGLGLASYSSGSALYYVGYFSNGQFSGKGVLMYSDGQFLSGDWKNGTLNGKGSSLNKTGDLYVGEFLNGTKNGKGVLFYKDNGFLVGQFSRDQFEGRNIYVSKNADVLTDNIYHESKKNGSGYQYELATKKLFEGVWQNGTWVNEQAASYKSFLKDPSFYAEQTENQTIMGGLDKTTRLLADTAFFYDKKKNRRFFGRYDKGYFASGIIIGDSSRYFGNLKDQLANGYGSSYKVGKYYDEGNYRSDYLDGPDCLSLDLKGKTVYYGGAVAGKLTGKGFLANKFGDLYVGDFVKGNLTGQGYFLTLQGNCVIGTFEGSYVTAITKLVNANGQVVSLNPKSFSEAISFLYGQYTDLYEPINGQIDEESEVNDDNDAFESIATGLYTVPGSVKNYIAESSLDEQNLFISFFLRTSDGNKAFAKYSELCRSVQSATITVSGGSSLKLEGTINKPDASKLPVVSKFYIPGYDDDSDFHVSVVLRKINDTYKVYMAFGNAELTDDWIGED